MMLEEQIVAALKEAPAGAPLVDPRTARTLLISLARALGGSVEDETDYRVGRSYRFAHTVQTEEDRRWRTILHVTISAVGPFVTHTMILRTAEERWWSHNIRTSRTGFHPEDADLLVRLRTWYQENGLNEVAPKIQAQPAPGGEEETTLFHVLFRP